jgi:lipopolysaccharide export system protein LptA
MSNGQLTLVFALVCVGASFGATLPVFAQTPGNAFAGYSANADKPIDIEADSLEVDDKKQIATFRGNVSATQGEFNLKSRDLEVTYERQKTAQVQTATQGAGAGTASAVASGVGAADALGGGQIKYIKALGRVFVTSKDQHASGNEALFDVAAQKITMTGDVTLTQGGNVIKGEKLLIDITTGRSTIDTSGGKERLRAILTRPQQATDKSSGVASADKPGGIKPQEKPKTAAPAAQPDQGGWKVQQ